MTPLAELRAKRAKVAADLVALVESASGRAFDDTEEQRWKDLKAERDELDGQIEREAEIEQERRTAAEAAAAKQKKEGGRIEVGEPRKFQTLGENVHAAIRSFEAMRTGGTPEPRFRAMQEELRAATGAGETVGVDGGFLVEKDILTELMTKAYNQGEILRRVNPIPIGPGSNGLTMNTIAETSRATGSRYGALQMYWVGEGDAITASRPKYDRVQLELQKLAGLSYATDELLQDATAHGALLERAFVEESIFMLENGIFQGGGGAQPLGILGHAGTIDQAKETGQDAATIVSTNISKMWARLWARSRPNAVWIYNQDCEPQLDELFVTAGTGALDSKVLTMGADGVARIKGRPAVAVEYCAALGTTGDIMLCDFSQYVAIDKGGLQTAVSIHVQFTQDETTFRFIYRFNGQPTWKTVLTPFSGGNTVAPFVSLATRA